MTFDREAAIQYAIPRINGVLVDRPEHFPDEAQVGQGTIGAMAVGADIEAAVAINIRIHEVDAESTIGGSKYLAGAVLYLSEQQSLTEATQ